MRVAYVTYIRGQPLLRVVRYLTLHLRRVGHKRYVRYARYSWLPLQTLRTLRTLLLAPPFLVQVWMRRRLLRHDIFNVGVNPRAQEVVRTEVWRLMANAGVRRHREVRRGGPLLKLTLGKNRLQLIAPEQWLVVAVMVLVIVGGGSRVAAVHESQSPNDAEDGATRARGGDRKPVVIGRAEQFDQCADLFQFGNLLHLSNQPIKEG